MIATGIMASRNQTVLILAAVSSHLADFVNDTPLIA
jgi:hypothetical protein